ncbi:MAG: hypothetical protein IJV14_05485 [Lachnospiraceae bacterium]|nr:hypothetical protein [Lachnospiraceae bacterium]
MATIKKAKVLAEPRPEGLKSVGVILEYDSPVKYTEKDFIVEGRDVLAAEADGCKVTLTLNDCDEALMTYKLNRDGVEVFEGPRGPKKSSEEEKKDAAEKVKKGPPQDGRYTAIRPQYMKVTAPEGVVYADSYRCPLMERFEKKESHGIEYLLYVPENYDPSVSYPMVMFIADANGVAKDPFVSLAIGIGGSVWATPESQKEHPCFVLIPSFRPDEILTHDDFTYHPILEQVGPLIEEVADQYSIDRNRIYGTGESMGCMSNCQLDILYPDLFAAQILVAGQWDPVKCGPVMKDKPLWIMVSSGDMKAHPGMDAITAAIEENGGKVGRYEWDAKAVDQWDGYVADALKDDVSCRYVVFKGNSVIPEGMPDHPGSHHVCTWRVAYQIKGVRDWLFSVHK